MKNRIVITLLCIALFASLVSCANNSKHPNMPDDFNFSLRFGVGGKNKLDTYEDTFTNDLVLDGLETIDFVVPEEEKQRFYEALLQYGVDQMPNDLGVDNYYVTPANQLTFTYTCNGSTKSIVWAIGAWEEKDSLPEQNNQFLRFVKFIREYIYETDQYKNMPPSNGGYC